jgi:arsenate reductase (glutaredoxin)
MITIYHKTTCSKSRSALQILEEKGIPFEVRFYMHQKLNLKELRALLKKLKLKPTGLLRRSEPLFEELNNDELKEQDWLRLMVKHPELIERPVVENDDKAIIARPPERVLEIL